MTENGLRNSGKGLKVTENRLCQPGKLLQSTKNETFCNRLKMDYASQKSFSDGQKRITSPRNLFPSTKNGFG